MEDIVLVTGRHRTRSHYNIVFNKGQNSRVLLRVQTPTTDAVHWQVLRQQTQGAMLGRGPSGKVLVAIVNNQWTLNSPDVFLRTYLRINVYLSEDIVSNVFSGCSRD